MQASDIKINIAIDGFSSSGKSTMAKALARKIGYRYVDTGAMYRAVTLFALEHGLIGNGNNVDADRLTALLPQINIRFALMPDGTQHTILNGTDVEDRIRSMEISSLVSHVSSIPSVRHHLVALQQDMGAERGVVMDGRDIGTTVFPDAELKIYLNASAQTRAHRRFSELTAKGVETTFEAVLENVEQRDHLDMTRQESPLRRADDALDLDNSAMTPDEQNQWLLDKFILALEKARKANEN
ncbi:MAG: (d)CMP kinase [Muribaculaceae bacterium]|nr:(d)CMP kinase [Muribaculaceae bacterium]